MKINICPHPTKAGWFYAEFRPNGSKGARKRIPFETMEEAVLFKERLESKLSKPQVERKKTIAEAVKEYLPWVQRNRAKATYQNKRARFEIHIIPALGHYRIENLSQTVLDAYGANMAKISYRDDIHHILALITWMEKRKYCDALNWRPEIPNYNQPVKNIPDPADILVCIECIPKEMHRICAYLMLYTGIRWNECKHLRWENYDGDSVKLATTKRDRQQKIYIPEYLRNWFESNRRENGWIFTVNGITPICNLERPLKQAAAKSGVYMTHHLFRHASATLLYATNKDLYEVRHHLRHSRITTTEIYTRYSIEKSKTSVSTLEAVLSNIKNNGQQLSTTKTEC